MRSFPGVGCEKEYFPTHPCFKLAVSTLFRFVNVSTLTIYKYQFNAFSCLEMQHMFCSEGSIGSINCLHYYFSSRWVHNCITKHVIVLNNRDYSFAIEKKHIIACFDFCILYLNTSPVVNISQLTSIIFYIVINSKKLC